MPGSFPRGRSTIRSNSRKPARFDQRLQRHPAHHAGTGHKIRGDCSRARSLSSPQRYYLWLPRLRIADMWLRPRTETLPSDSRWWEFDDEPRWSALAIVLGVVNLFYVLAAICRMAPLPRGRMAGIAAAVCGPALGISGNAGKSRAALHAGDVSDRNRACGCRAGREEGSSRGVSRSCGTGCAHAPTRM